MGFPVWVQTAGGAVLAAILAYASTPVAIRTARHFAFYDLPVGYKGHGRPTPYLGGSAVIAAFAIAILLGAGHLARTLTFVGSVAVLGVVGTIDDRRQVSPGMRVTIEFALGALLALDGLGWSLGAGRLVDVVITGIWIVGVVNAFNLFDNMDGQASTMAIVAAAGTGTLALIVGDTWVAAASFALCGACAGFLPHNLSSPARIFLGDGGSIPIGFAVAVLAATAARHAEPGSLSLLVGFLLVGIPALDTTLVIVSRTRRGVPILTGGRDHLTHRTRRRMGTPRRVALTLGGAQAIVSAVVIAASQLNASVVIYIVLSFVVFAATAIVALEDTVDGEDPPAQVRPLMLRQGPSRRGRISRARPDAGLIVLGLAAGLSPLFSAYYAVGIWVPMGIVAVVVSAMALVARPPRCTRPTVLALAAIAGLGIWSLISAAWAGQTFLAETSANLWLTYSALVLLVVVLIAGGGRPRCFLAAAGAGVVVVAITVLVRLLGSDPATLFDGGRLNSPLGYVNGEGAAFAMGAWLCVALAERRQAVAAGVGAGLAVCMAELTLLTQSRGAAVATLAAIIVLLIVVPGFRRRVFALTVIAAGTTVAAPAVARVYATGGVVTGATVHHAVLATLAAAAAVAVVWAALVAVAQALDDHAETARLRRTVATALAVVLVLIPFVAAAVRLNSLQARVRAQWDAFVHLSSTGGATIAQTRLFSGGGNRYDYWRVAWHAFEAHPLIGVGGGNYVTSYYLLRHTQESIQNPHSLELQTLSELGIVGILLLALLVVAVVIGIARSRRVALGSPEARTVLVAALGTTVVWFVDTSGDWMHLLPGVTAVAIGAIAVLCQSGEPAARAAGQPTTVPVAGRRLPTLLGAGVAVLVLAVGGASLLRAEWGHRELDRARDALSHHPATAISAARAALRINGANLDAYYVEAAGQARFDRAAAARATLLQAAHQAPRDFVTWVLLGDLEARAGHPANSSRYYRRALRLDPREPGLAALVAHPEGAVTPTD